jgi:hypothetical protein
MKTLTAINSSRDMNTREMDLDWVPEESRSAFKEHLNRLAARVWAHLTWGRWTAIGLFVVAFIAALWLKHNWVNAPVR